MIIESQAPTRISLIGGGTDHMSYSFLYGGMVLSMAINLRQKIKMFSDEDIWAAGQNSFPSQNVDPTFVYNILKEYKIDGGHLTKIHSTADCFISAGLGSSSSLAVALIAAINKRMLYNLTLGAIGDRAWISENAFHTTGKQDVFAATFGGCNILEFPLGSQFVNVVPINKVVVDTIRPWMHLHFLGGTHKKDQQQTFKELTQEQIKSLGQLKELTVGALDYFIKGKLLQFSGVMDLAWKLKKKINPQVTNEKIDEFYEKGVKAGAVAGKILGAGGGGYFLFLVPPDRYDGFVHEMGQPIDFSVDYNGAEARIL